MQYAVIEVNPRVSRSSALASKATGYPIAKVATRIAIGYTLDEIINQVTGKTYACFEPALDYVVVKYPKWAFDKFVYAKRTLGTQMKATGEVMAIGTSFEQAIMKAVRSIELGVDSMNMKKYEKMSLDDIMEHLQVVDDERAFQVFEALKRGVTVQEIHDKTMIDCWFLDKLMNLVNLEKWLADGTLTEEKYKLAKQYGYLDATIERMSGQKCPTHQSAVYKMVDTCAGEFKAETPYFYSTYDEENEALQFMERKASGKKKVIVFGSGPIRIGQGIEFDYCSVHCVWTLKEMGYEAVICNNNPETVSTDFDTGDRLYFDPLTKEDVANIIETEKPYGVVVQFGGQTAINLTRYLSDMGVNILGTTADDIDAAEDRERFDELLSKCGIPRPAGLTVMNTEEALAAAQQLGYPVLMRPSYVLGGQNMIIAHSDKDIVEYMAIITSHMIENPVLIDKYMMGTEVEVDAICDGTDFLIPGIMEHIERAGIHSGDSISIYPAQNLSQKITETIVRYTGLLAKELHAVGLINIQYVVYNNEVYVIEVNPRSSRTVPYISKVTGIPMVDIATKIMLGETLKSLGYQSGLHPAGDYVAVKVPVFSFEKLQDVDTMLGPEMKSTGECLGIGRNFEDALLKGLIAAGYDLKKEGGVLISVRDTDKQEIIPIADRFSRMGFELYGTSGTANVLNHNMIATNLVRKISEGEPNTITLLESGKIHYMISTSEKGRMPARDSVKMRRKSVERSICCLTAIDTASALSKVLESGRSIDDVELIDITKI
jgi:carbamoyl-phosphate synthase large subunit